MTVTTAPPPIDPIKGEPPVLNDQASNERDIVQEAGPGSPAGASATASVRHARRPG
jgi:hypothetical protein